MTSDFRNATVLYTEVVIEPGVLGVTVRTGKSAISLGGETSVSKVFARGVIAMAGILATDGQ